jgi:hypothetical protein
VNVTNDVRVEDQETIKTALPRGIRGLSTRDANLKVRAPSILVFNMLWGVFAGRWLDNRFHAGLFYTAPLLMLCAAAGCWWGRAGAGCKRPDVCPAFGSFACQTAISDNSEDIEQPPEYRIADGHRHVLAGNIHLCSTGQACGGLQGNAAYGGRIDVVRHFKCQRLTAAPFRIHSGIDFRQHAGAEANIQHRPARRHDGSN